MPAGGVEVARAFVTVIPKSDGTSNEVINSIVNPLDKEVSKAGTKAGKKFNANLGSVLSSFAAPVAIGTALVGVAKAGIDTYEEVQGGMREVIKATGATGESAEALEAVYKDVAKSVVGDFEDIGTAVGQLNTYLGINGEDLEAASEAAMKYAKINEVDVGTAIADVSRLMNNAGIDSSEFGSVLDKLTVAAQQSGVDVQKLAQSVNDNAVVFQEMGLSTDEAIAMLANFEKTGANTSQVLAGMKKGVQNWAKEGKSAQEGFAEFVAGVESGTITSQEAIDLFGAKAGLTMFDAAQKGQLSFEDMFAAIQDSSGAVDQVYEDTLSSSERIGQAWQQVKVGVADVFAPLAEGATEVLINYVLPAVSTVLDGIGSFVSGAIAFFSDFDTNVSNIWNGLVGKATEIFNNVKTAVMTPITVLKSWLSGTWTNLQTMASTAWEGIKNAITTPIETAKSIISGIIDTIKGLFNFSISWPHIPTPHFGISPPGWSIGDLLKGSIPSLSIEWYEKGDIFTSASVIGVGESGPEAVVPLRGQYMRPFAQAIAEEMGDGRTVVVNMYIDGSKDPEAVAETVFRKIKMELRTA